MVKSPPANAEDIRDHRFDLWVRKMPWRREWQLMPVFILGESHEQRSLATAVHRIAKNQIGLK